MKLVAALTAATIGFAWIGPAARAEVAGGSNYAWYALEGCSRDQFTVLANVAGSEATIRGQLRTMFANGQRRLRVPLLYRRDLPIGDISVSRDGLSKPARESLGRLLRMMSEAGFDEVLLAMFPIAESSPLVWQAWREDIYRENWNVIQQAREIAIASGLPYKIDLLNEAMPFSSETMLFSYAKRVWADYSARYGTSDTIGFSIIADAGRASNVRRVYGKAVPPVFDVHLYEDPKRVVASTKRELDRLKLGHVPWIIGETFYNAPQFIDAARSAAAASGVRLSYFTQWPISESKKCADVDAVPLEFPGTLARPPGN